METAVRFGGLFLFGAILSACATTPILTSSLPATANWDPGVPIAVDKKSSAKLTIATYYLPHRMIHVSLAFDDKGLLSADTDKQKSGLGEIMVRGAPVIVQMKTAWQYDHVVKVTTQDGFLLKVDTSETDQTANAINAFVTELGSLSSVAKVSAPAVAGFAAPKPADDPCRNPSSQRINARFDFAFDPTDKTSIDLANARLKASCIKVTAQPVVLHSQARTNPVPKSQGTAAADTAESEAYKIVAYDGVIFPVADLYDVSMVVESDSEKPPTTFFLMTMVPDDSKLVALDVNRSQWSLHKTTYDFDNGIFKNADVEIGNQVTAVAVLPLQVLKAILSVPAEIIRFRVNYDNAAAAQANQAAALVTARAQLEAARKSGAGSDKPATTAGDNK